MDIDEQKQQFSFAYIRAVASTAGFVVTKPDVDDDSVDLIIGKRGGSGTIRSPRLDIQVKASSQELIRNGSIHFPLKQKNYHELIGDNYCVSRLLVIVLVPENISDWITQSEKQLALRKCGYWVSLRGMAENDNETATTVQIPCTQIFSVEELNKIMSTIEGGGKP